MLVRLSPGWLCRRRAPAVLIIAAAIFLNAPGAEAQGPSIQFKSASYTVKESGPVAIITVIRSGNLSGTSSVDFRTVDLASAGTTAEPGMDYQPTNGMLIFNSNVTTMSFGVPIIQDPVDEPDEKVILELFNFANAIPGGLASATLTITDDDTCTFVLTPTSRTHGPEGSVGTIVLTATPGCQWSVTETADWVGVVPQSGIGNSTIDYSVDPNPTTTQRSATLRIAGKTFTITQRGIPPPDVTRPTVSFLAPAAGARVTNSPVTVTGKAVDGGGIMLVEFRLENAAGTNNYQPADGTTNWSATIRDVLPGLNTVRVRAMDTSGNFSTEVARTFNFVVVSPLNLEIDGNGRVTGAVTGQYLDVGRVYSLNAIANPLQLFACWGGDINTNGSKLTFRMQTNLHLRAKFVANPFIAVKGAYNGLFRDEANFQHESSGFVTATTTDLGAYSAKLTLAGRLIPISGKFALDGRATNEIVRPEFDNPITVRLQLHFPNDESNIVDRISGELLGGNWTAQLTAHRAVFNAATYPAPQLGKYTLLMAGDTDAARAPLGMSCGTVSVDAAGKATFSGTLADGTKLTQKTTLSKDGDWPLFGRLYGGGGSALGWMKFAEAAAEDIAGSIVWTKPPVATGRLYTNGFVLPAQASGSRYKPPTNSLDLLLHFTEGAASFSGANIDPAFSNAVHIEPGNKVVNSPTNSNKLTFTIALPSGRFSGAVTVPGTTRSMPFSGALHIKGNYGGGFLLGTNQGGRVLLEAAP